MGHPVNFKDMKVIAIVLFVITSLVTSYRCIARYRKKLWGHDDTVALLSLFFFTFFVIGSTYLADESAPRESRIAGAYILVVGFYTPVWGARISIILTVVRITPWAMQRKIMLWVAAFFTLLWVMLVVQTYWVCEITLPGWKQIPGSICVLPKAIPITQFVTTIVSDCILIATPLMVAKGVRIRAVYYRLFFIFSVSIATTIASVVHAVMVMVSPGPLEATFGGVEAAVSIIVGSMSVIIPAVLRVLGVGDPFMQEDTVDPKFSTGFDIVMASTTTRIELGLSRRTVITDSDESEDTLDAMGSRQRNLVDLNVKNDEKHQLTTQASDGSLGNLKTAKVLPLADECDITDSLAQERSSPCGHDRLGY